MAAGFPWHLRSTPGASDVPHDAADLDDVSTAAGSHAEATVPDAEATVPDAEAAAPDAEATLPDADAAVSHAEATVPAAEQYRSLLGAAAQVLDRVDRALGELADGSYGRCRQCGAVIDDAILETDPTAQHCTEHAAGHDPAG